jgi:hypothetical protein
MMAVRLQEKNQIGFDAINMSETESVYTIPASEVEIAGIEGMSGDLNFYKKRATYPNTTTYDDLKSIVKQIFDSENRIGINSISYSKNEEDGTLSGNIDVYYYSATGTGKEYTAPDMTPYSAGTSDIFNSTKTTALAQDEAAEGETEGAENEEKDGEKQ